jgi:hypothetical protein
MTTFNWLHLTDLHWGLNGQGSLWPNVRQAFFEDLAKIHDRCGPWQAVLFSGDLVQQGTREEYEQLEDKVFGPLMEHLRSLGSGDAVIIAVPGNHDLIRPDTKTPSPALKWLLKPDLFADIADDVFIEKMTEYRQVINEAFNEYSRWWDNIRKQSRIMVSDGILPGDVSATFELSDDYRVGIVGLNTSFLQLTAGDYQQKLAWDLRQFHKVCGGDGPSWVAEHNVCLLLTHQGPTWLNTDSSTQVYPEINPAGRFAAHLFGHMHTGSAETRNSGCGEDLRQWQACSMFGMEKFGEPPQFARQHGYSAGRIEFSGGNASIRQWPRIAVKDINGWRLKPDDGVGGFLLQDDQGTKPEPIKVQQWKRNNGSQLKPKGRTSSKITFTERQALEAYIKAARRLWDIIDLAGLPEDDRHLAMNKFLLRQLYAPLRLTVEMTAEQALKEENADQFESQRNWKRLVEAGLVESDEVNIEKKEKFSIGQRLSFQPSAKKREKKSRKSKALKIETNIVSRCPRLIILGDPGAGKTTLLRWLATAYLLRHVGDEDSRLLPDVESLPMKSWLPILVRCRELDKTRVDQYTLEDMLRQTLSKLELSTGQIEPLVNLLRRMLERGEALLLVDGLDEITESTLRAAFCGRIESVAEVFNSAPIVITSRIVGYREMKRRLQGRFEHTTLADLMPKDKDVFVGRWCDVTISDPLRREIEVDKLIRGIHGSDRIERLTGNPMMLTTMALVQRKVGNLPTKRHKLYWEGVNVLLNWRSDVDDPLDADEALPQLEYVAWAMCDRGVQRLRRDELLELLEGVRRDYPNIRPVQRQTPENFLAQLERRTGLLVEMGHEQHQGHLVPVYEFKHLTFQEYLAALAIIKGRYPGHNRESNLAERVGPLAGRITEEKSKYHRNKQPDIVELQVAENWREALRLCVASCNDDDVDAALLAILGNCELDETKKQEARPRAAVAALCLADEPNVCQKTAEIVLQCFARQVREPDGNGVINTVHARAAMELARGQWFGNLQEVLIGEFKKRESEERSEVGALLGLVREIQELEGVAVEQWIAEQTTKLTSSDIDAAISAALSIMIMAFRTNAVLVPGLIEGLMALFARGPAAAHAASWALGWLLKRASHKGPWQPTDSEVVRLLTYLNESTTDPEALRWLTYIAKETKSVDAIPALRALLKHPNKGTRKGAISALVSTQNDDKDMKLIDENFQNEWSGLDPLQPIENERVQAAAKRLKIEEKEVRRRYEKLADDYGLIINWDPKG